ncbi:MAG TPA: hypothetical protein VEM93_03225 [Actinomycetota bacterium]|nr:hypothetical protein [Actinomycetota bacterium]
MLEDQHGVVTPFGKVSAQRCSKGVRIDRSPDRALRQVGQVIDRYLGRLPQGAGSIGCSSIFIRLAGILRGSRGHGNPTALRDLAHAPITVVSLKPA